MLLLKFITDLWQKNLLKLSLFTFYVCFYLLLFFTVEPLLAILYILGMLVGGAVCFLGHRYFLAGIKQQVKLVLEQFPTAGNNFPPEI